MLRKICVPSVLHPVFCFVFGQVISKQENVSSEPCGCGSRAGQC